MEFWNFFSSKRPKVNDNFFGEMLFMEVKNCPADSYLECWCHFEPANEEIELGISGNLSGPTQVQKNFFRQVEKDYALLIQKLISIIETTYQKEQFEFKAKDFGREFKLTYLFIPTCVEKPIKWEIAFESVPGLVSYNYPYTLTIEMADYEPQHVSVSQ